MIGRESGLEFQVVDEVQRFRQLLPDAGQEGRPVMTILDDQSIHAGAKLAQQIIFRVNRKRLW